MSKQSVTTPLAFAAAPPPHVSHVRVAQTENWDCGAACVAAILSDSELLPSASAAAVAAAAAVGDTQTTIQPPLQELHTQHANPTSVLLLSAALLAQQAQQQSQLQLPTTACDIAAKEATDANAATDPVAAGVGREHEKRRQKLAAAAVIKAAIGAQEGENPPIFNVEHVKALLPTQRVWTIDLCVLAQRLHRALQLFLEAEQTASPMVLTSEPVTVLYTTCIGVCDSHSSIPFYQKGFDEDAKRVTALFESANQYRATAKTASRTTTAAAAAAVVVEACDSEALTNSDEKVGSTAVQSASLAAIHNETERLEYILQHLSGAVAAGNVAATTTTTDAIGTTTAAFSTEASGKNRSNTLSSMVVIEKDLSLIELEQIMAARPGLRPICLVNCSHLKCIRCQSGNNIPGRQDTSIYRGHYVVVNEISHDGVTFMDPAPPRCAPACTVSREIFSRAWSSPGTDKDCLLLTIPVAVA